MIKPSVQYSGIYSFWIRLILCGKINSIRRRVLEDFVGLYFGQLFTIIISSIVINLLQVILFYTYAFILTFNYRLSLLYK